MGIPTVLDAVVLAPAAALGLLGLWLGFGRWLVSWPMRWLVPLFGASAAAAIAALYLIANGDLLALVHLDGLAVRAIVAGSALLITFLLLAAFMGNLQARVAVWTARRRAGFVSRAFGGLFGVACGLVLVAVPYGLYEAARPPGGDDPGWMRDSLVLPYFRSAAATARSAAALLTELAEWR